MIKYDPTKIAPPYYPIIKSELYKERDNNIVELSTRLRKQDNNKIWRDVYLFRKITIPIRKTISGIQAANDLNQAFHWEVYSWLLFGEINHPVLSEEGYMFPKSETQESEQVRLKQLQ